MITIKERPPEAIEARLANAVQCVADRSALATAISAEHIRALLYGANTNGHNAVSTIHTTRLMRNARRVVELTWPRLFEVSSAEGDVCALTLVNMGLLGDAVDTGRGQWLAGPLRLVSSNSASNCLVLGSPPVLALQNILGATVVCAGTSRFVESGCLADRENRECVQSVDSWLGETQPLQIWTAQVLAWHETRMEEMQNVAADQLELYAPDILRRQRRAGRWIPCADIDGAIDGLRLARPRGGFAREYDRPHYLAYFSFRDGSLCLRKCTAIAHELTLRLRFGLDVLLNAPRHVSILASAHTFSIEKPVALPNAEGRVYGLGWRDFVSGEPNDRLTFHSCALPFVVQAFQRLCITPSIAQRSIS